MSKLYSNHIEVQKVVFCKNGDLKKFEKNS